VADDVLAVEKLEAIRRQILQEHPEMEGAEVSIAPSRRPDDAHAVAAKAGMVLTEAVSTESHYVVTLRKEVQAEDGVTLPLVVRVTVDAQGRVVKRRQSR